MAIKVLFGAPGAGKTTHAAMICKKCCKHNIKVFANFPVEGAYEIDPIQDFGVYNISNGVVLFDEAGITANNRKFANKSKNGSIPQTFIEFLKLYRHFHIKDIYVYSQAPDDMDITIRRLSTEFYLLKKSIIPQFSYTRRISRIIGQIDPITKQITDGYQYVPLSKRYFFRPLYYNMFDSWSVPPLPEREFKRFLGNRNAGAIEQDNKKTKTPFKTTGGEIERAGSAAAAAPMLRQNEGTESQTPEESSGLVNVSHEIETNRFFY